MFFPYPWCLLPQTSLAALFMGFNAPSCLQSLNLHTSAALPLQIDNGTAWDPTWDTISPKQCHCFGLLYSHILELHKGESCVKRTTSLFQTINILWVCWATWSCIILAAHTGGLSVKAGIQVNAVGAYQILKSHQSPHRACCLGLDPIKPSARWNTLSAVCPNGSTHMHRAL